MWLLSCAWPLKEAARISCLGRAGAQLWGRRTRTQSPSLSLLLERSHLSLAGVWVLETVGVMDDMLLEEADNWAEVGGKSGYR